MQDTPAPGAPGLPRSIALAWTLLSLWCVAATAHRLLASVLWAPTAIGADRVSQFVRRFDALQPLLPKHGSIDYASDGVWRQRLFPDEPAQGVLLPRFALLPMLAIVPPVGNEWLVGDFADASAARRFADAGGLAIVADAGNGVLLLRRSR